MDTKEVDTKEVLDQESSFQDNPFRWYVIHVAAGSENKVKSEIHAQCEKKNVSSYVKEILIPKKKVFAIRRGVKAQVEDRVCPGYVFISMHCTAELLQIIRQVPRVMDMLGSNAKGLPKAISEQELNQLLECIDSTSQINESQLYFEAGERVKVCDGLFNSMEGIVDEVDTDRARLKVSIPIFGRSTPVDLSFSQVEKIS